MTIEPHILPFTCFVPQTKDYTWFPFVHLPPHHAIGHGTGRSLFPYPVELFRLMWPAKQRRTPSVPKVTALASTSRPSCITLGAPPKSLVLRYTSSGPRKGPGPGTDGDFPSYNTVFVRCCSLSRSEPPSYLICSLPLIRYTLAKRNKKLAQIPAIRNIAPERCDCHHGSGVDGSIAA